MSDAQFGIIFGLLMFIAAFMVMNIIFGYNLTEQDIQEGRILALCIETDIVIPNCWDMVGKLGTDYGEPLQ